MHLTGFCSNLSYEPLWFHFLDVFFLGAQVPLDHILHIFNANILSAFIMVLPLLTITMKKKSTKRNTLKTSLNQIPAFISLNVHALWGPI